MNTEFIVDFLKQYENYAFIISIAISVFISLVSVLPSFYITAANILVFGPISGFFISWLGETLGALLAFIVYRFGLKDRKALQNLKYPLLKKLIKTKGLPAGILVLEGRLIPFIPSGLVTIAASISDISLWTFILWTALGKIPSLLLESMVGYDLIHINTNYIRFTVIIVSLILIHIFYHFYSKKNPS